MSLPFVRSGDTSQPTQSVPHPLKGVWADFVEEDYNADTSDPERVQILGDVDEWPVKAPVWLHCPLDSGQLQTFARRVFVSGHRNPLRQLRLKVFQVTTSTSRTHIPPAPFPNTTSKI